MTDANGHNSYDWTGIADIPSHAYLGPTAREMLSKLAPDSILDLGCGDGRLTDELRRDGFPILGLDFSLSGIARAREQYPNTTFEIHDLGSPLPASFLGAFDVVIAVEVIEHLLLPRELFRRAREALRTDAGCLLMSTPYHGYLKNMALSITGKWDKHFTALTDFGHVKFFSPSTLDVMANEMGFSRSSLKRVGRIPPLAASMVVQYEPAAQDAVA